MAKTAVVCLQCGHRSLQWMGRCPSCGKWDSFAEEPDEPTSVAPPPLPISEIDSSTRPRIRSGIDEFDRVLGGGIVAGSTVLVAGEPGVGKSTLLLQAALGYEDEGREVIVVCGEESAEQVASRAERIAGPSRTRLSSATDLPSVIDHISGASIAVIDSIQTLRDPNSAGEPGSPSQVRSCAGALARAARQTGTAVLLIGHVTKDGSVAGPRVLEHLVDAVITFEGDRGHSLRTIRASKNRFGPTAEIGVFEMSESGLKEVTDASTLFLLGRQNGVAGSMVGCVLEGRRPLAVEVQALCTRANAQNHPRRVANGVELSKVALALAILDKRAGITNLRDEDVYVSVAGGFQTSDPGIDLSLALSLASASRGIAIAAEVAAIGELALGGDIRGVAGTETRVRELARLGFKRVLAPVSVGSRGIEVVKVSDLRTAISLVT